MASISNLAVIISGQTAPLEASLKKAESKVSHFGKSFKEGAMLGAGVMGVDKLEQAMKKAIAGNKELSEAAEEAEESFGRILLKVTGIGAVLPTISKGLKETADALDSERNRHDVWRGLQLGFMRAAGASEEQVAARRKNLDTEFEKVTALEQKHAEIHAIEEERAKLAKDIADAKEAELKSIASSLDSKLMSLDPSRENAHLVSLLKASEDPFMTMRVAFAKVRTEQLEKANEIAKQAEEEHERIHEEQQKLMEDGKKTTEEQETLLERLARKQEEYNRQLRAGAIDAKTYYRATAELQKTLKDSKLDLFGMIRDIGGELQKKELEDFLEKGRKLIEEQVPDVERFRKEWERASKLFTDGKMDAASFDAFFKQYKDALLSAKPTNNLAGAASGTEAYTAIVQAQASSRNDLAMKQLNEAQQQTKLQAEQAKQLAKLANGGAFIKMMSLRGAN